MSLLPHPRRRVAWALALAASCFYLLCTGGFVDSTDAVVMYRLTESLVEEGSLFFDAAERAPADPTLRVYRPDGTRTSQYGLAPSLAFVPGYLAGKALHALSSPEERALLADAGEEGFSSRQHWTLRLLWYAPGEADGATGLKAFGVSCTNSVVVGLTVALLFLLALELGAGLAAALATAAVAGLASPLWPYAHTTFSEPLAGLLLTLFLLLAMRGRAEGARTQLFFCAGLALGAGVLTRVTHGVLLVPGALLVQAFVRGQPRRQQGRRLVAFALGAVLPLLVLAAYNQARFGTPFETGYGGYVSDWKTPPLEGLAGLLVSPGRGLLLYCPALLVALSGLPALWRRERAVALFIAGCALVLLGLYCRWFMWEGGWCFGPRFLVPVVPLLLLPLALRLEAGLKGGWGVAAGLALAASLAVAWLGVHLDTTDFVTHQVMRPMGRLSLPLLPDGAPGYYALMRWAWADSPLVAGWGFPLKDGLLAPRLLSVPGVLRWVYLAFLGGLAAGLVLLSRALRPLPAAGTLRLPSARLWPWGLALLALLLYAPALGNGLLVNWDDDRYVTVNPLAASGLTGLVGAFTGLFDRAWYPLTQVGYVLVHAVAGPSAFAHHLLQWALFALAVALAPRALRAFGVPATLAPWAVLLWAVHPQRVESVVWAANLKDGLSLLGVVGAFALYGAGRRGASAVAFGAGLLAKSMVFPVALLFPLLEARVHPPRRALLRALPWLVPALGVALVAFFSHMQEVPTGATRPGGSLVGALPTALYLPWWYLVRILTAPHPQATFAFEAVGWTDARLFLALGLWGAWGAWMARRPKETRGAWVLGTAAYLLPFGPVLGLVPLGEWVAERYTLLPALAVASGVVLGAARLRLGAHTRAVQTAAVCLAVGLLCARTLARQPEWHSSIALWEADVARVPQGFTARYNLGSSYEKAGRWAEAIVQLEEAWRLAPTRPEPLAELLLAHAAQAQRWSEGIGWAVSTLRTNTPQARLAVARAAQVAGHPGLAQVVLSHLPAAERTPEAHLLAAQVAHTQQRYADALAEAQAAQGLEEARVQQGLALVELGRLGEALAVTEAPAREARVQAMLQGVRALVLRKQGRTEEAAALMQQVMQQLR